MFYSVFSFAQLKQITEKEAQLQQQFIEAKKEILMARYDQAEKILLNIIKENEAVAAVHFEMGNVYAAKGDDQRALGSYNRAIAIEKSNKWYYIQKIKLLDKIGSHAEAAVVCEQLTQIDQTTSDHYNDWAYHAIKAGNPELAITALEKLEAKQGPNINIAEKKVKIFQTLGQPERIKTTLEKLLTVSPGCIPCLTLQADYFADIDQPEEATKVWQKILILDPSNADAKIAIAAGKKAAGDDIGFLESIKPLFINKNVPYDSKMKELLPYIQKLSDTHDLKLGESLKEALNMLEETNPDNPKTKAALADVAKNTGNFKEAAKLYKECLELDKSVYTVWEQRLYTLDQIRDYSEMLKTSNDLLDIYPGLALANYWNALALIRNYKPDDAINSINLAFSGAKKNPPLQYKLNILSGMAWGQKKELAKSQEAFKVAQTLNPTIDWAYYAEARVLAELSGSYSLALELSEKALKNNINSFEALAAKAFVLMKNNNLEKSKTFYDEALSKGANDYPELLEEYGDLLFKLNDSKAALNYWKMSMEKGTELPSLRRKIDGIK